MCVVLVVVYIYIYIYECSDRGSLLMLVYMAQGSLCPRLKLGLTAQVLGSRCKPRPNGHGVNRTPFELLL